MISLKQVQLLEDKVEQAVRRITELQAENTQLKSVSAELKGQNDQLVRKVADLEEALSAYEQDKDRIEEGIAGALQRLNNIESSVMRAANPVSESAESPAVRAISQAFSEEAPVENSEPLDASSLFKSASEVEQKSADGDENSALKSLYLSGDEDEKLADDFLQKPPESQFDIY